MGYLIYDNNAKYELEDRALAHLKLAIGFKLRRQESFFINWPNPLERGSGRFSVWVSPHIPIVFQFAGSRPPNINTDWVNALKHLSQTPRGITMISERDAEEYISGLQLSEQQVLDEETRWLKFSQEESD